MCCFLNDLKHRVGHSTRFSCITQFVLEHSAGALIGIFGCCFGSLCSSMASLQMSPVAKPLFVIFRLIFSAIHVFAEAGGSGIWSSGAFGRAGSSSAAAAAAGTPGAGSSRAAGLSQSKLLDAAAAAAAGNPSGPYTSDTSFAHLATGASSSGAFAGTISEQPPVGCAPDAYKLFVGNIPKNYTEENLRPVCYVVYSSHVSSSNVGARQQLSSELTLVMFSYCAAPYILMVLEGSMKMWCIEVGCPFRTSGYAVLSEPDV